MTNSLRLNVFVFFAVFFSSMLGAQLLGVSLNKIALIPLELYLIFKTIKQKNIVRVQTSQKMLLLWFVCLMISSAIGLTYTNQLEGYAGKLLFNLIQYAVMYVPILLMMGCIDEPFFQLKKSIEIVAQINSIWAIVQFVCWYAFAFDFNSFFFNRCLHGILGSDWTAWNFETGSLAIRATGLNSDPAFLAVIMVLGFAVSKSFFWKALYLFACVCAMSRVGMISIGVIMGYSLFVCYRSALTPKRIAKIIAVCALSITLFVFLYSFVDIVRYQVDYTLARFLFVEQNIAGGGEAGTTRHFMYVPLSILTFCDASLLEKILGVGPRIGGTALTFSGHTDAMIALTPGMQRYAWCIECDFAESLLGSGLLGFALYYFNLCSMFVSGKRIEKKLMVIGIFVFGFMYCANFNTLINLCFIFMVSDIDKLFKAEPSNV